MTDDSEKKSDPASETGDRQEYYLDLIRKIVDEQKDFLGDKVALKQARRAPLHIDKEGNVVDFYGSGEKALETLRSFTDHQEFYLRVIQSVVDTFKSFLGEKTALSKARKAPLFIDKEGEVSAYYGRGRNALEMLVKQFETVLGKEVAQIKIRHALKKEISPAETELLPEKIRPNTESPPSHNEGLINKIIVKLTGMA